MLCCSIYDMVPFIVLVYLIVMLFSFFETILDKDLHNKVGGRAFLY